VQNFLPAFERYCSARTQAPTAFVRYSGLAVCSAALENRVFVRAGFGRIYPSWWLCLVGPSHVRKTTATNMACSLLRTASPTTELPQDFSREALVEHLADRPYGLLRWSELGRALEALGTTYNNGAIATLTEAWDSEIMTRKTKASGTVRIDHPALSIIAAGKMRWIKEHFKARDIGTGFLGRWLFVYESENLGYKPFFGPPVSDPAEHDSLVEHLASLTLHPPSEMLGGSGSTYLEDWLKQHETRWREDVDPAEFSKRAGAQITKLAIAVQASHGTHYLKELVPAAVQEAIDLWLYAFEAGRKVVSAIAGHGQDSDELERIMQIITRAGGMMTRRDLAKAAHLKVFTLDNLLETLVVSGLIEATQEQLPGGTRITYQALHDAVENPPL